MYFVTFKQNVNMATNRKINCGLAPIMVKKNQNTTASGDTHVGDIHGFGQDHYYLSSQISELSHSFLQPHSL